MQRYDYYEQHYREILENYLEQKDEQTLYQAQQFQRQLITEGISPEEALQVHIRVVRDMYQYLPDDLNETFNFLLEGMMAYGLAFREYQNLRQRQRRLESDIDIAAKMQQTFLQGEVPASHYLDIGVLSQPAKKMSGDYFHFVQDEDDRLSVAIADIIGNGIPAALSMSMIKYAMDSVSEQRIQPGAVLSNLNRVVEQNVDPDMFVTMLYGFYDPEDAFFRFASAGHEPGFFYQKSADIFTDLQARGLVLGAKRETAYHQFSQFIDIGDMIVLLSDGVTECRTEEGFIQREQITDMIRDVQHLSAQQMVEDIFYRLEKLQHFQLRDDFTLMILRRHV